MCVTRTYLIPSTRSFPPFPLLFAGRRLRPQSAQSLCTAPPISLGLPLLFSVSNLLQPLALGWVYGICCFSQMQCGYFFVKIGFSPEKYQGGRRASASHSALDCRNCSRMHHQLISPENPFHPRFQQTPHPTSVNKEKPN